MSTAPRTLAEYLKGPPKVSQHALARQAGVAQSMISMLARGKRAARGDLAYKLHDITHVPLDMLMLNQAQRRRRRRRTKAPPGPPAAALPP